MNKIKIKYTSTGYKTKPTKEQFSVITNELKKAEPKEVTFKELKSIISEGRSFILANFIDGANGITKDLIKNIPAIGLDVDSKENSIKIQDLIKDIHDRFNVFPIIAYNTFSDVDNTRFRLIYQFGQAITDQEYQEVYKGFLALYGQYLDSQTGNCNRAWAGTNKAVSGFEIDNIITDEIKEKIKSFAPKEVKRVFAPKTCNPIKFDNEILNRSYIKSKFKDEICDIICNSIDIKSFILDKFGGSFTDKGNKSVGCCSLHGGDNKGALVIYKDTNTYRCYTHCGSGNVVSVAYKAYNTNDFSSVVFQLMNDYKIDIPKEAIGIKGDKREGSNMGMIEEIEVKEAVTTAPLKPKGKRPLLVMSSEEYLNSDIGKEKGFLIDRLIPENSLGMLVAPAKCNKTTLAYDIALSVATGKECISHTTKVTGKVLYISIEGSLQGLLKAFGYSENVDIIADKYFQWEDYKDDLIELIKEKEYKLIVIDPLYKATKKDIAKAKVILPFLRELEDIANTYKTTFLLCHHTMREDNLLSEASINKISGSMNLVRASEFTIMLEQEKKTEEEEREEFYLSDEEREALPKKRILRKLDYRYGKEGFTKFSVNIDFKHGNITGHRYNSTGERVKPKARIEDLYNHSIEIIEKFPVINKGILTTELAKIYTDLTENTMNKNDIPSVWEQLEQSGKISREKGHNYRVVRK